MKEQHHGYSSRAFDPDTDNRTRNGTGNGHDKTDTVTIYSKAEFVRGFRPPSYLVDGILQRRFIYSLTGVTGHAKTAIALLIADLVSGSDPNAMLLGHRVRQGRVLYFVGENPDDVRMRVIEIGRASCRERE